MDVEQIKESRFRENFLAHSIIAPVGRSNHRRDHYLSVNTEDNEANRHLDERVLEGEREAFARHLGLPAAPKRISANLTPLGGNEIQKAIQEVTADGDEELGRGIGFGSYGGGLNNINSKGTDDRLEAIGLDPDERAPRWLRPDGSRSPTREGKDKQGFVRKRGRDSERQDRHHRYGYDRDRRHDRYEPRHRSRSRSQVRDSNRHRAHRRRSSSRSRSRNRRRGDERTRDQGRDRHYSPPYDRRGHGHSRRERDSEHSRRERDSDYPRKERDSDYGRKERDSEYSRRERDSEYSRRR